jgi:hypothetical protein
METKGFFLIATSHPYFGRMAANLASSIKAASPESKICVVADEIGLKHLNSAERNLFDIVIDAGEIGAGIDGAMNARLNLPNLTPFDLTISIDVDTIWLPKADPNRLFKLLDDFDFTIVNEGYVDLSTGKEHSRRSYTHWADVDEIKEAYDLTGKLYKVRGEFIVFRNTDAVATMFAGARDIRENPKVDVQKLALAVTDEFALNIAMNLHSFEPHSDNWQPAFWPTLDGGFIPAVHKLVGFYAMSFGGAQLPRSAAKIYETIAKGSAYKTKVPFRFPLIAKRSFSPERRDN